MAKPGNGPEPEDELIDGSPQVELASNRTGLALERTLMAADRTLLAIVRTSLALMAFGFTINEVFRQFALRHLFGGAQTTGRRLGLALLALGIVLLAAGAVSHFFFFRDLLMRRRRLLERRLLHGHTPYSATPTFIAAAGLLALGVFALVSVLRQVVTEHGR
jgi:putative membrane protein